MRTYTRAETDAIEAQTGLELVGWLPMSGNVLMPVFKRPRKRK